MCNTVGLRGSQNFTYVDIILKRERERNKKWNFWFENVG